MTEPVRYFKQNHDHGLWSFHLDEIEFPILFLSGGKKPVAGVSKGVEEMDLHETVESREHTVLDRHEKNP